MILYADASALVKRYLSERHTGAARTWFAQAASIWTSRIAFVEIRRSIGSARIPDREEQLRAFDTHWLLLDVVDLSQDIVAVAANVGVTYGLASVDAVHLASALSLRAADLFVTTFDRRLWAAARASGLNVLPETLE